MAKLRTVSTLRAEALDDLLTNTMDVLDDHLWDCFSTRPKTLQERMSRLEQYELRVETLIEQRMVEISQRSPEPECMDGDDDSGPWEAA